MAIQEFQYSPPRWAKLPVTGLTTQNDVDTVFQSVDTSGWSGRPRWDSVAQVVRWQILPAPYEPETVCPVNSVVAVERPYLNGLPLLTQPQAKVVAYLPGTWSDSTVTYL